VQPKNMEDNKHSLSLKKKMSDKSIEKLIIKHKELNIKHRNFIEEEMGKKRYIPVTFKKDLCINEIQK